MELRELRSRLADSDAELVRADRRFSILLAASLFAAFGAYLLGWHEGRYGERDVLEDAPVMPAEAR